MFYTNSNLSNDALSLTIPKILVVDDNAANHLVIKQLLNDRNIEVDIIEANSGKEAIQQVLRHNFAAILMDVDMPDMDGLETLEILHDLPISQYIPTILVTARHYEENSFLRAYNHGAVDFIEKPINPHILASKVNVFIDLFMSKQNLKTLSARLELILDSTSEGICGVDGVGKIIFSNPSSKHLLDCQVIGREFVDLLHDAQLKPLKNTEKIRITNAIINKIPYRSEEYGIKKRNNLSVRLAISITPVSDKIQKQLVAVIVISDITDLKQKEEELRRSQKLDASGKLIGGIAHDWNNKLGIILGYANLLKEALSDQPELADFAHKIYAAGERNYKLTRHLETFTRYKEPHATLLNINNLLQYHRSMLEKTLTIRFQLIYELADDLWPVELDYSDLEDAIVNISINSMHAMEAGGKLTIQTSNKKINEFEANRLNLNAGDYVLLTMADTGCGMDAITKEKIFDPFYTTSDEQVTGLGLTQVFGFVERSGGVIKVYSELGCGSCFAIYFPRCYQSLDENQPPTTDMETLRGNETLLVVDDEQAMGQLANHILTSKGYHVITASDGEQALTVLREESVDLLLTDVIMPNMDGFQLAVQVKQLYPHIKIQMTSGFLDHRASGGVDDALWKNKLHKPFVSKALLECVRGLLDEDKRGTRIVNV